MVVSCEKNEKHILDVNPVVVVLFHGESLLPERSDIDADPANEAGYIEREKKILSSFCSENTFFTALPTKC